MTEYRVDPEIAGDFGDNIEVDHSTTPLTVTRMHYEIETWLGSELLGVYPVFIATDHFVQVITDAGLTGFRTDVAEVTINEQGREYMADVKGITEFPHFVWFKPVGVRGRDDFSTTERKRLVTSQRALDVITPLLGPDFVVEPLEDGA